MDAVTQAVIDGANNLETYNWMSDPEQGPLLGQWLSQQGPEVFFVFGTYASPSSDSGYDSAWGFSSALFTPVPGISGIKIETLDIP